MNNTSCCFTGHREISREKIPHIKIRLEQEITALIEKGYTDFYAGGAIGFDMLAETEVLKLRKKYTHIRLHIIAPCKNQTYRWSADNIELYNKIKENADEYLCLSEAYTKACMHERNRYMVERSSVVIAFVEKDTGGAAATVKYARKEGREIILI